MWVFKNIFHLMVSFGDRIFRSCKARVVPREFDRNFDKDGAYEHKQVMGEGGLKGKSFLHFQLDGIQPLPGSPGPRR